MTTGDEKAMQLTSEQRERYREDGFLIFTALLPEKKRARYVGLFHGLVERAKALRESDNGFCLAPDADEKPIPGLLHKVQGVCLVEPEVLDLARESEILDRVESLLGPDIDMFGSKFFPMMVRGATSTGWHQDNYYFGSQSDRVLSCAIYLEDTDRDNGCLQVLPGSHRAGQIVAHGSGKGTYAHGDWAEVDESRAVDVVCPGGTVVLFSANLLHGARPNRSGRTSYRTAWHYLPGDLPLEMFPRGVYKDRYTVRER
jgi:hypothetical protein